MKEYLTIGDMAKLRNVDRKSLRYYERIGALVPAYTDPQTKYRYYTLEQLVDLDTILICLELGIPLKQAAEYKNRDGTLNIRRLFDDGKAMVQDKMARLQVTLNRLEASLEAVQEGEELAAETKIYRRDLKPRMFLRRTIQCHMEEYRFKNLARELFTEAEERGLLPLLNFPVGVMVEKKSSGLQTYLTLELLDNGRGEEHTFRLPEADCHCCRVESGCLWDPLPYAESVFRQVPETQLVVLTNLTQGTYRDGIFPLEIQAYL